MQTCVFNLHSRNISNRANLRANFGSEGKVIVMVFLTDSHAELEEGLITSVAVILKLVIPIGSWSFHFARFVGTFVAEIEGKNSGGTANSDTTKWGVGIRGRTAVMDGCGNPMGRENSRRFFGKSNRHRKWLRGYLLPSFFWTELWIHLLVRYISVTSDFLAFKGTETFIEAYKIISSNKCIFVR